MENGLDLVFILLLGSVCLAALLTLLNLLFPSLVGNARQATSALHGRSVLVGLVNALFFFVLAMVLGSVAVQIFQIIAVLLLILLAVGATFGLGSLAPMIGERVAPQTSEPLQAFWGAGAMILACLTPYVGWFGLLPYLAFRGLGGVVLGFFPRFRSGNATMLGEDASG
jgi:hypothetical protein